MPQLKNLKSTDIIFTEKTEPGLYVAKNGWYAKQLDNLQIQLFNPQGEPVSESRYGWEDFDTGEDWTVFFLSFADRYGRSIDAVTKWNPAHFPRGTIVFVDSLAYSCDEDRRQFYTVDKIIQNGGHSFVIEAMEVNDEEGSFKGRPESFNINWVTGIMYRPPVSGVVTEEPVSAYDYPGAMSDSRDFFTWLTHNHPHPFKKHPVQWVNYDKALKRLMSMNLATSSGWEYRIKTKEAAKFLKKNPHWMFMTVKEVEKQEAEEYERLNSSFNFYEQYDY
jgi:hypothetical protein